ncbi:Sodium/hydrogen exchanger 9B2 [Cichlidogyrus casuarinus]|uniref:Sodium/hydrogen exchanger 9B2 n=1 Tax=Cichlidogyrus casuarinus TaxID=1844966 RepID=A0ABD2Q3A8_9PLAT
MPVALSYSDTTSEHSHTGRGSSRKQSTLQTFFCLLVSRCMTLVLLFALLYATIYAVNPSAALPPVCSITNEDFTQFCCSGGQGLSVLFLYMCSVLLGLLFNKLFRLPGLMGMLLAGILIRLTEELLSKDFQLIKGPCANVSGDNFPTVQFVKLLQLDPIVSMILRYLSLAVILARAGLNLNVQVLKKSWLTIGRIALFPSLAEALIVMVVSTLLIKWPWSWGAILGFVLSSVSPAVVVPEMLKVKDTGYGYDKGIPTIVLAAASLDNVIDIIGFGISFNVAFSPSSIDEVLNNNSVSNTTNNGDIIGKSIGLGIAYVLLGIVIGVAVGFIFWLVPQALPKRLQKLDQMLRILLATLVPICLILITEILHLPGTGSMGTISFCLMLLLGWQSYNWPWKLYKKWIPETKLSTNCSYCHKKKSITGCNYRSTTVAHKGNQAISRLNDVFSALWWFLEPILFVIVGTKVNVLAFGQMELGLPVVALLVGIVFRFGVSVICTWPSALNWKERTFLAVSWIPKATIQAAIGANALDKATELGIEQLITWGELILTLAVLSILITAPVGAVLIARLAKYLLKKRVPDLELTRISS